MKNNKVKLLIEIAIFIGALGVITAIYYFDGNDIPEEEEVEEVGIVKINDDNLEKEVLKSEKTVILEFSSNSCPPCLTMIPTMINIAKNNKDIKVANINSSEDNTSKTLKKYNIEAFPTIIIFKNGEVAKQFVGATSEETIMREIK